MSLFSTILYSHELTRQFSNDDLGKFTSSLAEAKVQLNPHQIEAALFAFNSPYSKGAILADEVGLGKTIEAGLLLSQHWAERKRKIIIIAPASLRKQWSEELWDKFYLPSEILDKQSYTALKKQGIKNPFKQENKIIIVSYEYIKNVEEELIAIPWDLVVIDEAHRLRNIFKGSNKTSLAIQRTFRDRKKILLTATPIQNSLSELFGLCSFIDEHLFGDHNSFKKQFSRLNDEEDSRFFDLKERLKYICKRTLRKDVLEYVPYTNRISMLETFKPSDKEQELYEKISAYLQREDIQALPKSQRHLITMVMRKLLASSSFAITGTLDSLIGRLKEHMGIPNEVDIYKHFSEDFEALDEEEDEWGFEEENEEDKKELDLIKKELEELMQYKKLAESINENEKAKTLITALEKGLKKTLELGGQGKAVIFTESKRTQDFLYELLNSKEDYKDKIVIFNGTNTGDKAKKIYNEWLIKNRDTDKISESKTANQRQALVDYFREEGKLFIATEAAAEGINLQFCSLVINYDLPWNPQRIEQRIGRCHRYGQKHDVVVINFINESNAADKRVYELLDEKFNLFKGVFGASDDVLGVIESGVDFEKRILDIYQKCRNDYQIEEEFNKLQNELKEQINDKLESTRKKLLDNFDTEVHYKLKTTLDTSTEYLDRFNDKLLKIAKYELEDKAIFDDNFGFEYQGHRYKIGRMIEDAHQFSLRNNLANDIIQKYKEMDTVEGEVVFDYFSSNIVSALEPYINKSGYLLLSKITVKTSSEEEYFIYSALDNDGNIIEEEVAQKFFELKVKSYKQNPLNIDKTNLFEVFAKEKEIIAEKVQNKNDEFFEREDEKISKWAEDLKNSLNSEIADLDREIKEMQDARRRASGKEKITLVKELRELEKKRDEKEDELKAKRKDIDRRKNEILDDLILSSDMDSNYKHLFLIKWKVE